MTRRTPRARLFDEVGRETRKILRSTVDRERITSIMTPSDCDPSLHPLLDMLVRLDALSPFEREEDEGIREVLQVEFYPDVERAYVTIQNAIGRREHVTTFGCERGEGTRFDRWSNCREDSPVLDDIWDAGRRVRRVVDDMGQPSLVDRGAVAICEILTAGGCETRFSCEGHPDGAYLMFEGAGARRARDAFASRGWIIEAFNGAVVTRMPPVAGVAERDAAWRDVCDALAPMLMPDRYPAPRP